MSTELEEAAGRYHAAVTWRKRSLNAKLEAFREAEELAVRYRDAVKDEEAAEKELKAVASGLTVDV